MTVFTDRADAGRRLAHRMKTHRGEDVVVLGLPRGGVVVAYEVALALGAPLDVVVVRKLGVPYQPEVAMGAIGEDGVRVIDEDTVAHAGITEDALADSSAPLAPPQRARVEVIQRNGERLLKLVNTLLDFSRMEAGRTGGQFEPLALGRYTAELASMFDSALRRAG